MRKKKGGGSKEEVRANERARARERESERERARAEAFDSALFSSSSFLLLLFALKNTHLRIEREASEDHRSVDLGTHLFFFSRFFFGFVGEGEVGSFWF